MGKKVNVSYQLTQTNEKDYVDIFITDKDGKEYHICEIELFDLSKKIATDLGYEVEE